MTTVIRADNISKAYQLGEFGTGTLSQDLQRWWITMRGGEDPFFKIGESNDRTTKGNSRIIWSLKDINFEVQQGTAIGIIGRNGAGKSTLLKLLSRVTMPTSGTIKVKGRIASLLEVGTGFHPELSGKENIYLNGAILGMKKNEIKAKFDEIVDFSGVERYIDTPVKRYSSGMYVRLAFAVAAHLESEILIVDEVLAVGDAEFQKKCLGKMSDVSKGQGRTVLFVSHNMAAVNQLCTNTIYLSNGKISEIGETSSVVSHYLNAGGEISSFKRFDASTQNRSGNGKVQVLEMSLSTPTTLHKRVFSIGESIEIKFTLKFNNPNESSIKTSILLKTSEGQNLANMIDVDSGFQVKYDGSSTATYSVTLHDVRLYPDTYYLGIWVGDMSSTEAYDFIEDCMSFEIIDGGKLTSRRLPRSAGLLFLTPDWSIV